MHTAESQVRIQRPTRADAPFEEKNIKVYIMDLWSFIPYYLASLCVHLRKESVEVVLGSVSYHLDRDYFDNVGLALDGVLLDFGGAVRFSHLRRLLKAAEYLINLLGLGLRFLISRPDIVHVQYLPFLERGFPFESWFMSWLHLLGVHIVYTVHNLTPQDAPGSYKDLYQSIYRISDALICHGNDARLQLIRDYEISENRIWTIPHGPLFAENVELSPEAARNQLGLQCDRPLVLCLGVISRYKGIPFLLDAWRRLIKAGVRARLLIAGTGDPELLSEIREKAHREGIGESVDLWLRFIPVEQLPLLYQAADILVYPYKAATTSGALLTGMNYGRAIVATDLSFFQEHLTHGQDSILVQYGDVDKLAEALSELIQDEDKRARLARAIKETPTSRESWRSIAVATLKCYTAVCQAAPLNRRERTDSHGLTTSRRFAPENSKSQKP